ncbi:hypothetical protein FKM82_022773 [Ascaphus truei]
MGYKRWGGRPCFRLGLRVGVVLCPVSILVLMPSLQSSSRRHCVGEEEGISPQGRPVPSPAGYSPVIPVGECVLYFCNSCEYLYQINSFLLTLLLCLAG